MLDSEYSIRGKSSEVEPHEQILYRRFVLREGVGICAYCKFSNTRLLRYYLNDNVTEIYEVDLRTQQERAETFRRMHHGKILILPNAWDAASAAVLEAAGFPAIATTSAGVANSLGYPDGQRISLTEMTEAVRRIVESVSVPVTADMEGGYGETEESAVETVHAAISVGAIGINLEDGVRHPERRLVDLDLQVRRIRAARDAAISLGVPIVINARTDVYLAAIGEPDERLQQAVKRGQCLSEGGRGLYLRTGCNRSSRDRTAGP
jgi:2-methylisocitrate lyase-like PEP mutase family enzyme